MSRHRGNNDGLGLFDQRGDDYRDEDYEQDYDPRYDRDPRYDDRGGRGGRGNRAARVDPRADRRVDPRADPRAGHRVDPRADPRADRRADPRDYQRDYRDDYQDDYEGDYEGDENYVDYEEYDEDYDSEYDEYDEEYADEYADDDFDHAEDETREIRGGPASERDDRERGKDRKDRRGGKAGRAPRGRAKRKRGRKGKWIALLVAVGLIIGGAAFGVAQVLGFGFYPDYGGSGTNDVIFQVNSGDSVRAIGNELTTDGIVASANAFVKAAKNNSAVGNVQPGYYQMKQQMSGAAAVAQLVKPSSRVGQLEIRSGTMLNDTTSTAGVVTPGILSNIAKASCAMLDGKSTCITAAQFQQTIANTSPAALGVPSWAVPSVEKADPEHRLEGLLPPGLYNIRPGDTAVQDLTDLLGQGSAQLQAAGLLSSGQQSSGFSPYQLLIVASIVERESGTDADMPKIAEVLYNRLAKAMPLGLDSTVDYALNRPMVLTAVADQAKAGAYNTYAKGSGLPPTPISSPSNDAIAAAMAPATGPYLYFVVCQKDHSSCFGTTLQDQDANIRLAQANGAY